MKQDEAEQYVGKHVTVRTVDGHKTKGYLQSVGYQAITLLRRGQRYAGPHLADIESITTKE